MPNSVDHVSKPRISRRCSHCGVTLRVQAIFCPQCGKALYNARTDVTRRPSPDEMLTSVQTDLGSAGSASKSQIASAPHLTAEDGLADKVETTKSETAPTRPEGNERFKVTASVRGGMGDKLRPQIQRVRTASNNAFNQASYDPTLRFVLVAVLLFVVTVLLIVVGQLIQ